METISKKGKELSEEEIKKIEEENKTKEAKPKETEGKVIVETPEPAKVEEEPTEAVETPVEPLYQKKVYLIDLRNIGMEVEGVGSIVVDVMAIDKEWAIVRADDTEMKIPKDFLF